MKPNHFHPSFHLGVIALFTACHLHTAKPITPVTAPVEVPQTAPPTTPSAPAVALVSPKSVEAASPPSSETPLIVEAENGVFTGTVDHHCCWRSIMLSDAQHSTHSGKGSVDTENAVGSYTQVTFNAISEGPHTLTIRYVHPKKDPRPAELRVNEAVIAPSLHFPNTSTWTDWRTISTTLVLKPGRQVIRLTALQTGGLANIDYFKVSDQKPIPPSETPYIQLLEAEDGEYSGKIESHSCWQSIALTKGHHSGFTGTGFVDAKNEVGSSIEVTLDAKDAGTHTLSIRYVHVKKDDRSAEIRVNGDIANPSLYFPQTGAWTAWQNVSTPVELKAGKNLIRVTALHDGGLVNIDHFALVRSP
jgi:FlaG/FlaF family flagellin (archaellin)